MPAIRFDCREWMGEAKKFPYHLFQYYPRRHFGSYRIIVKSASDTETSQWIATLPGARWDKRLNSWHVPDNKTFRALFHLRHEYITPGILKCVHATNRQALEDYVQFLELKAYSHHTIRTYLNEFVQLLTVLKSVKVEALDAGRLKSYFLYCLKELNLS